MRFNAAFLALTVLPGLSLAYQQPHHGARLLQRRQFSNSSSITSSASTTSAAPSPTASVDLSDATLQNAELTTINGQTAVVFSPPANGQASLAVNVAAPNIGSDTNSISASFTYQVNPSTGSKAKRQDTQTDCTLIVTLGGTTVYNQPITTNGGSPKDITTGSIGATDNTQLAITESCGDDPVTLGVYNVALVASSSPPNPSASSAASSISSPTATGTDTVSFSTPTGSATGSVTGTTTGASPTGTTTAPTSTSTPGFPSSAGNFQFYGCVGSAQNFPTFNLVASSVTMDIETCTGLCGGSTFAGIYQNQCYCGSQIDGSSAAKVSNTQCNLPCPGNANEFCGGNLLLAKRQAVPAGVLLTVYINVDIVPVTTTATVTALATTTAANGSPTTVLATVTTTYCPICQATAAVSCVSGYCGAAYAFVEYAGSDCGGEIVYIVQECSCAGGWAYTPILCTGNVCVGLVVYKPVQCGVNSTCNGVQVFTPNSCSTCQGGVIFNQQVVAGCNGTACAVTGGSSSITVVTGGSVVVSGSGSTSGSSTSVTGGGKVITTTNTTTTVTTGSCGGKTCVYTAGSSRVAASSLLGLAATFLMALF